MISCVIATASHAGRTAPPPQLTFTRHPEAPPGPSINQIDVESNDARRQLAAVTHILRRQFETSAEYVNAVRAEITAWQQYQQAQQTVLSSLRSSVEYRKKQIDLANAEQRLDDARSDASGTLSVAAAAKRAANSRAALRKIENDALGSDEGVTQAKQAYLNCARETQTLRQQFRMGLTSDPQWRDARARLDAPR
jgi:hypothetical protein